jgi:CSLREA domain-containing protein
VPHGFRAIEAPSMIGDLHVSTKKSLVSFALAFLLLGTVMPGSVSAVGPAGLSGVTMRVGARATPGELFAITLSLPPSVAAFDGRVYVADGAAEVIGVATGGAGTAFMPVEIRGGYAIGAYGLQPSGSSTDVEIVVNPLHAGRLQLRIALDAAADSSGNRIDLAASDRLVTIGVGGDVRVVAAPAAASHPTPLRGAGVARGPLHGAGVNVQDLGVLRADWQSSRARGAVCRPNATPADGDANGDGCVDIADVQAIAAAGGLVGTSGNAQAASLPAGRTAAPLLAATFAHTFTVTSTADTPDAAPGDGVCADTNGNCTLRAALTEADYQIGTDRIAFNLPGTAPVKIQLTGGLPLITSTSGGVMIDGYSQPGSSPNTATVGSNAVPGVMISGNGPAAKEVALYLTSSGSTIRGLILNNIWRGIFMDGAMAHDNQVVGNWVGFNPNGTPNGSTGFAIILNVGANHNVIGTPALADRNVIGNFQKGVDSYGPGTDFNVIQNNVFCIGPSGFTKATCNTGVDHDFGPKNELLGGFGTNERNVFGPTLFQGIEYSHGWNPSLPPRQDGSITYQINNNQAFGNWVGFRGDGSYDPAYRSGLNFSSADNDQGINVYDGTNFNVVDGNYIASVFDGIQIEAPNATGNIARNNIIGVSPLGEPAPLTGWGFKIRWNTTHDTIQANTIRNAALGGVGMVNTTNTGGAFSAAFNIRITQNIITDTPGLAIQLFGGANDNILPPVISSATTSAVTGTAVASATIEVYHGTRAAGQNGLPDIYLGSTVAGTSGAWTFNLPAGLPTGYVITALQIRPDDTTSQLAANVALGAAAQTAPAITSAASTTFSVGAAGTFSVTSTGSPTPALSETGALPGGVTFTDNGNGTAALAGTPAAGTAGTYPITITAANGVLPNASQGFALTVSAAPPPLASDTFARTTTSSWGNADIGGSWVVNSTASDYNVNGSAGTMLIRSGGTTRFAALTGVSATNLDVSARISRSAVATGGGEFAYLVARRIDASTEYRAKVRFAADGGVYLQPTRVTGGVETSLGSGEVRVTGLTPVVGSFIWLHATFSGTNPTAITLRAWADGSPEPATAQVSLSDGTAALQAPGTVGLRAYLSASATNAPVTMTFDDITAR